MSAPLEVAFGGRIGPPPEPGAAGFLDRVVAPDEVLPAALKLAAAAAALDARAHAGTKRRARGATLAAIEEGLAEFERAS